MIELRDAEERMVWATLAAGASTIPDFAVARADTLLLAWRERAEAGKAREAGDPCRECTTPALCGRCSVPVERRPLAWQRAQRKPGGG